MLVPQLLPVPAVLPFPPALHGVPQSGCSRPQLLPQTSDSDHSRRSLPTSLPLPAAFWTCGTILAADSQRQHVRDPGSKGAEGVLHMPQQACLSTGAMAGRRHYAHGGAEALAALRDVTQLQQQDCVTAGWAGRVGAFVAPGASA